MSHKANENDKHWNKIKANDSWAIFKIMAELVEGFEKMAKIGPCVSIFGSPRSHYCWLALCRSAAVFQSAVGV